MELSNTVPECMTIMVMGFIHFVMKHLKAKRQATMGQRNESMWSNVSVYVWEPLTYRLLSN